MEKIRKVGDHGLAHEAQEELIGLCDRLETLKDARELSSLLEQPSG